MTEMYKEENMTTNQIFFKFNEYSGSIEYSEEDQCWHGKLLNIKDLVTYESEFKENLYSEFLKAIEDYIIAEQKIQRKKHLEVLITNLKNKLSEAEKELENIYDNHVL